MPWEPLPRGSSSDPKPLAEGLDRVARSLGVPSADALTMIFSQWSDLVGEAVAANCRPTALREHTLSVAASDPAWTTQLRMLEPVLLERLAELVGKGVVTSFRIRVDPT